MKKLLIVVFAILGIPAALGQNYGMTIQVQNSGTTIATATHYLKLNFSTGFSCAYTGGAVVCTASGGGGGVSSFTGDGTVFSNSASTGAVTATLVNTPTGTGSLVLANTPTLITPVLGAATGTSLVTSGGITSGGGITLNGSSSGNIAIAASATAAQLSVPTATVISMTTGSGDYRSAGATSLTSLAGTTRIAGGQNNTANVVQLNIQPTNSSIHTSGAQYALQSRGTLAPTSGSGAYAEIIANPVINQTGGANGTIRALASYPVNTALVGTEYLIAAGTSSAVGPTGTLTDKFLVDSSGNTTASGTVSGTAYLTATKCAAAGSAASPSLVACSAAPTGSFSCATNASTATCVISTTAVTANSAIFVQPSAAAGTLLSVTCNATSDTGLTAPRLASISGGASFTINLGTFSTNPECFSYWIVN